MERFSTVHSLSHEPLGFFAAGLTINGIDEAPSFYCEYTVRNDGVDAMFDESLPEVLRSLKDKLIAAGATYVYMANPKQVEPFDAIVLAVNFTTGTQSDRSAELARILSEFTERAIAVE